MARPLAVPCTPVFAFLMLASLVGGLAVALPGGPAAGGGGSWPLAGGRLLLGVTALVALAHATRSYRALRHEVGRQMAAEARARADAFTDDLTGLLNRRGFRTLAEHQLRIARRAGTDLLALYVDLDAFKAINDRLGHAVGDRALCDVAALLRATVRETDLVARLGGDEFVVLAVGADAATEGALRSRLAAAAARTAADRPYALALSIGAARFDDDRAADLDGLLHRADSALYAARRDAGPRGTTARVRAPRRDAAA